MRHFHPLNPLQRSYVFAGLSLISSLFYSGLMIIVLSGCGGQKLENSTTPGVRRAVPVIVSRIQRQEIAETIAVRGDITPLYQVDIYSKVNGLIRTESAVIGKRFEKGEIMAEVEQDIPGMEFSPVKIEATRAGIVIMDAVEIGSRVSPSQKLYTLQEINQVYLVGSLIESALTGLKTGMRVTVQADALPGHSFAGTLSEISPVVNPATRMGSIKILIDNPHLHLRPGMFARCELHVNAHPALVVPLDAIAPRGANRYVFVVQNDTAHQIKIETGIAAGDQIEIMNGPQAGDRVVVIGQNLLDDGSPVRIVEEK